MCDIRYIRSITEEKIPELADKIFVEAVDEDFVFNNIFLEYVPLLEKELAMRSADEIRWIDASNVKDIVKLKAYVKDYDNEAPEYIGRHVVAANKLIRLISTDNNDWHDALTDNTIESYKHYLTLYDKKSPEYIGLHVDEAKKKVEELLPPPVSAPPPPVVPTPTPVAPPDPRIADDKAWADAKKANTVEAYEIYLAEYGNQHKSYNGIHVEAAKLSMLKLQDEADWIAASRVDSIESYQSYVSKYSGGSGYEGQHLQDARDVIERLTPKVPTPDPRVEDDEAWGKAVKSDTIDGYRQYLAEFNIHDSEAERAIRRLIDEDAWNRAKSAGTKASFEEYLSICKVNEYPGYSWLHINEAENSILWIQQQDDWDLACSENTLASYNKFIAKYESSFGKTSSIYLIQAKKRIEELTAKLTPFRWKKWILIVLALALGRFLWIQWQDDAWPFNIILSDSDDIEKMQNTTVFEEIIYPTQEEIDSIAHIETKDSVLYNRTEKKENKFIEENSHVHNDDKSIFIEDTSKESIKTSPKKPVTISDFELLANQGDKTAYSKLSKLYLAKHLYDKAAYWANMAWNANIGRVEAKEVIDYLEGIDYYKGAKYENPTIK